MLEQLEFNFASISKFKDFQYSINSLTSLEQYFHVATPYNT